MVVAVTEERPNTCKTQNQSFLKKVKRSDFLDWQHDYNTKFHWSKCLSLSFVLSIIKFGEMMEPLVRDCHDDLKCFDASTEILVDWSQISGLERYVRTLPPCVIIFGVIKSNHVGLLPCHFLWSKCNFEMALDKSILIHIGFASFWM